MASYQYIYTMKGLSKSYPGRDILKDVYLSFLPGAKIGVVGLNGAGKSTLLKIMAGEITEFSGEAFAAKGARVGYLPQEPSLDPSKDVMGNVMEALAETRDLVVRFNEVTAKLGEEMSDDAMNALYAEMGDLQEKIDAAEGWDLERTVEIAMDALRCPSGDADVSSLSGGERRRVALCRLLLEKPDILLLDEPTNHLDAESVAWLERFLKEYKGTVVCITHDRYFLDNIAGWILEIFHGRCLPFEGNYSGWLESKAKRQAQEEKSESSKQKHLAQELEWIRQGAKGRQTKSKARVQSYEQLVQQDRDYKLEPGAIYIPAGQRLGAQVVELKELSKAFGDELLIDKLSLKVPAGAIVGIIGPNGAGKSTLFKMIAGAEQPTRGEIVVGETVDLGYVDQVRDKLDDKKTVWQVISDGLDMIDLGGKIMASRAYVGAFNFKGADQQKAVGDLSGGERNRVHLACTLKSGANVLLLDEPTNDLDVDTLRALEEAILRFIGSVFVISHDRYFLDRIATHIIAFEGNSEVVFIEGNYADYAADLRRRKGDDADKPERIKYKRITR